MEDKEIEELKTIFVTRKECDTQMDAQAEKINKIDMRGAITENRLDLIIKILAAIGTGVISLVVGIAIILFEIFMGG